MNQCGGTFWHKEHGIKGNDLQIYDTNDSWWSETDRTMTPLRRLVPARVRFLGNDFGDARRVLDLGCGGGYMTDALAREHVNMIGVDLAHRALIAARNRAAEKAYSAQFLRASAESLPFENHAFDGIICTDVLVHVPEPARVIAEISRVLKIGGWLHFSSINRNLLAHFIMITLGENWLRMIPKGTHNSSTFLRPDELDTMLAEVHLKVDRSQGLGPVGWAKGAFTFGAHPFKTVMYQGIAIKTGETQKASH